MNDIFYDAFISYRHTPCDIKIAKMLQSQLEQFHIPNKIQRQTGVSGISRVFRDQEDLSATSDLSENIRYALDHSYYLIVICSKHTKESAWVQREIAYFLQNHTRKDIFTVLAEGEPFEVIPDIIFKETVYKRDKYGNIEEIGTRKIEPLSVDYRLSAKKAKRTELPRLVSGMIGCDYRDLFREIQRKEKRRLFLAVVSVWIALIVCVMTIIVIQKNQSEWSGITSEPAASEEGSSSANAMTDDSSEAMSIVSQEAVSGAADSEISSNSEQSETGNVLTEESISANSHEPIAARVVSFEKSGLQDHIIEWHDDVLEFNLRTVLDKQNDEPVYLSELYNYAFSHGCSLDFSTHGGRDAEVQSKDGPFITDITDLQEITCLRGLNLNFQSVSDLSPLSNLTNLEELYIQGKKSGDYYEYGHISNIEPLKTLTKLRVLNLNFQEIKDLSPLEGLHELRVVFLEGKSKSLPQGFTDVSPLARAGGIMHVSLTCNLTIENKAGLAEIIADRSEDRYRCTYSSGNHYRGLIINDIGLGYEELQEIVDELSKKETGVLQLSVSGCPIEEFSVFAPLISLIKLNVTNCQINDAHLVQELLEEPSFLPNLRVLDLSDGNQIEISDTMIGERSGVLNIN